MSGTPVQKFAPFEPAGRGRIFGLWARGVESYRRFLDSVESFQASQGLFSECFCQLGSTHEPLVEENFPQALLVTCFRKFSELKQIAQQWTSAVGLHMLDLAFSEIDTVPAAVRFDEFQGARGTFSV